MNAKVQEFIEKMKAEQKVKELQKRKEHLISLGLIDENNSFVGKKYLDQWDGTSTCHWDNKERKYYKMVEFKDALEVSDEEYLEILKYCPLTGTKENTKPIEESKEQKVSTPWADGINTIANILLAVNIIGGITLFVMLSSSYSTKDFAWIAIVLGLTYAVLYYPLIIGFSKIVAVAEKFLEK